MWLGMLSLAMAQEVMTYTGGLLQKVPDVEDGASVWIQHTGGNVSVRCSDRGGVSAQLDYALEGTDGPQLEAMGQRIGLSATGGTNQARISTALPYRGPGISSVELPLVVTLPREVKLQIAVRGGWVEVRACRGTLTASADKGGIYASGSYSSFNLQAAQGDVRLETVGGEPLALSGASKGIASSGNIELKLPLDISGSLQAAGSEVVVLHPVTGDQQPTRVQGSMGSGQGASLYLQASGKVELKAP